MAGASFLDTGVALGYCFTLDSHFTKCRNYIEKMEKAALYYGEYVESEYHGRKEGLNKELSQEVLEHRSQVMRSGFEGELDPMDLKKIHDEYLNRSWSAYNSLEHWYRKSLPNFIQKDELVSRLGNMAAQIEANAIQRKGELDGKSEKWSCDEAHDSVRAELEDLPPDDLEVCIEAHDLADTISVDTELATVNPTDFVDNGRRELILTETALADVISVASRG